MPDTAYTERLMKMESSLQRIADNQVQSIESSKLMRENIEKLNLIILGNGEQVGLSEKTRNHEYKFTRIEEKEKNAGKHIWALYTAAAAGVADFFCRLFFNKG